MSTGRVHVARRGGPCHRGPAVSCFGAVDALRWLRSTSATWLEPIASDFAATTGLTSLGNLVGGGGRHVDIEFVTRLVRNAQVGKEIPFQTTLVNP